MDKCRVADKKKTNRQTNTHCSFIGIDIILRILTFSWADTAISHQGMWIVLVCLYGKAHLSGRTSEAQENLPAVLLAITK